MRRGSKLFLPGFGVRAEAYRTGLPAGWEPLQPPLGSGDATLRSLGDWLTGQLRRRPGRPLPAGHSMGAALAVLAAVQAPERIEGLVLIAPAGLPLTKPIRRSVRDALRQIRDGRHRPRDVAASLLDLARAPRASARLVH